VGRAKITNQEKDTGAFKTPTLRDVARSGPYFHDGSVEKLEDAVKFLLSGGGDNPTLDRVNLLKQDLKPNEVSDLIEFLKSLTEHTTIPEPKLP
jgi:cytochrome c peroxidase